MIDLKEVVEKYPECLQDAKRLKSILYDLYPQEKLYAGILASILDDGIVKDIQGSKEIDVFSFKSYCKKIESKHGFAGKYIEGCLNIWANAFGVKINTPPVPQKNAGIEKKVPVQAQVESSIHTHKYVDTVVPPSCTEKGYTLHTCDCGYEYRDSFTNAQHDYILIECSEPTCEKDGQEIYKCCCCGVEEKKRIPATGHKFGPWIEQERPSCTTNGYEVRACSICGKKERRTKNKTGHKFSPWRKEGEDYVRDCSACGLTEKKGVPIESVGQIIKFGRYPQGSGKKVAPIEWVVLDIQQGRALLFSRSSLAKMPFDKRSKDGFIPYADSDVRNFLVSDFEKHAFSPGERNSLISETLQCEIYTTYKTSTAYFGTVPIKKEIRWEKKIFSDRVFLLSVGEIEKYFGITHGDFSRKKVTKVTGVIGSHEDWLLRSQECTIHVRNTTETSDGQNSSYYGRSCSVNWNAYMSNTAYAYNEACFSDWAYDMNFDIRPAIWVDMLTSEEHAEIEKQERERKAREEKERKERELAEAKRREEQKRLEQQRLALEKERREKGVCQYCGGDFKGLFIKKCAVCGKKKDY